MPFFSFLFFFSPSVDRAARIVHRIRMERQTQRERERMRYGMATQRKGDQIRSDQIEIRSIHRKGMSHEFNSKRPVDLFLFFFNKRNTEWHCVRSRNKTHRQTDRQAEHQSRLSADVIRYLDSEKSPHDPIGYREEQHSQRYANDAHIRDA